MIVQVIIQGTHIYIHIRMLFGQLFKTYILVEEGDDFLIIDQHAAHERIKFEELKKSLKERKVSSQYLAIPIPVELSDAEKEAYTDNKDELSELGFGLILVAEDLDDLLTVHHFLDIAVYFSNGFLLTDKVFTALSCNFTCYKHHTGYCGNNENSKINTCADHSDKYGNNSDYRRESLRNTLGEHLAEGIDIVCIVAHNIAVSALVKILYGELLHIFKHLITDFLLNTL